MVYEKFQCRTQHFMWCNMNAVFFANIRHSFNAARSILCGATSLLLSTTGIL